MTREYIPPPPIRQIRQIVESEYPVITDSIESLPELLNLYRLHKHCKSWPHSTLASLWGAKTRRSMLLISRDIPVLHVNGTWSNTPYPLALHLSKSVDHLRSLLGDSGPGFLYPGEVNSLRSRDDRIIYETSSMYRSVETEQEVRLLVSVLSMLLNTPSKVKSDRAMLDQVSPTTIMEWVKSGVPVDWIEAHIQSGDIPSTVQALSPNVK